MNDFDPLEKLALLESHAIDWRHIPGYGALTDHDIAARLAHLSRGASLLGRVKIAGQTELTRDLIHWLKVEVYGTIIQSPVQPIHVQMVELAIDEVVNPRICRVCKGIGTMPEIDEHGRMTGRKQLCFGKCEEGHIPRTDYSRAKTCGVDHKVWKRWYARIYTEILTVPWTWEGEARKALT